MTETLPETITLREENARQSLGKRDRPKGTIMRIQPSERVMAEAERSVRNRLGSVWMSNTYFEVTGDYFELDARPVTVSYYGATVATYNNMAEKSGCDTFTVEHGGKLSTVLLDQRGYVWMIATLEDAPADWKPEF